MQPGSEDGEESLNSDDWLKKMSLEKVGEAGGRDGGDR